MIASFRLITNGSWNQQHVYMRVFSGMCRWPFWILKTSQTLILKFARPALKNVCGPGGVLKFANHLKCNPEIWQKTLKFVQISEFLTKYFGQISKYFVKFQDCILDDLQISETTLGPPTFFRADLANFRINICEVSKIQKIVIQVPWHHLQISEPF